MTRSMAVSVEWWARYADCSSGSSFYLLRWSISWRATSQSRIFDKSVRFDIGRQWHDFPSDGSMSGFFSNAALNCVTHTPDDSDLLNSSAKKGANKSTVSTLLFRECVGSGSVAHCLSESMRTAAMMSSIVRVRNAENLQSRGAETKHGCGSLAVDSRTPAIFSSKNRWTSRRRWNATAAHDSGNMYRALRIDYRLPECFTFVTQKTCSSPWSDSGRHLSHFDSCSVRSGGLTDATRLALE